MIQVTSVILCGGSGAFMEAMKRGLGGLLNA
jgi:hypothetical protein